ncbi:unnamed protein product [Didymodactylos carnosus]|uniref:Osteoclast-stimulating factor 1 n=1 Tax=Didymodactylos carnosus TaxID=1234261 RepID=A0A8S2GQW6_9BILA|nr:unnamed protein product [Didymodactylos carnosus]CAF3548608.1 unnamed protein product [Didymodactylos carnosus]
MSLRQATRPPPPVPAKPGQVSIVKALYNYTARSKEELSFEEGDILYITDDVKHKDWYVATTSASRTSGLVPKNYVEQSTEKLENALHDAAKRGNIEFLQQALANKASVIGLDKAGNTPLHWGAYGGYTECVNLLLPLSSSVINQRNNVGDTPLHLACWKNHPSIVQLLLDNRADKHIRNQDGKLPLDLTHDSDVRSILEDKVIFSNYKQRDAENGDEDSD